MFNLSSSNKNKKREVILFYKNTKQELLNVLKNYLSRLKII